MRQPFLIRSSLLAVAVVVVAGHTLHAQNLLRNGDFLTNPALADDTDDLNVYRADTAATQSGSYALNNTDGSNGWYSTANDGHFSLQTADYGNTAPLDSGANILDLSLIGTTGGAYYGVYQNVVTSVGGGNQATFSFGWSGTSIALSLIASVTDETTGATAFTHTLKSNVGTELSYSATFGITPGDTYQVAYSDHLAPSYSNPNNPDGNLVDSANFSQVVPEPSSLVIAALGLVAALLERARRLRARLTGASAAVCS